ncbi:MAG: YihA family ribosome biogenesis GTP-binding protein [Myxococcales bacterium]|nr:YihA family ribosome biogenesis GTP-binding protein [Myxococcales bacterium]
MRARSATFLKSAAAPGDFPAEELPEIAFAGRSNVGKSSLLNRLVGVGGLARTSRTPGRTQLLNWFHVEPPGPIGTGTLAFVDLPGYGYAKVPVAMQVGWQGLIEAYLGARPVLAAVVVIVDVRRGAEDEERDLVAWLAEREVATIVVVTKIDKLAKNKREPALVAVKRDLALPRMPIAFSAETGDGASELWRAIGKAVPARRSGG